MDGLYLGPSADRANIAARAIRAHRPHRGLEDRATTCQDMSDDVHTRRMTPLRLEYDRMHYRAYVHARAPFVGVHAHDMCADCRHAEVVDERSDAGADLVARLALDHWDGCRREMPCKSD